MSKQRLCLIISISSTIVLTVVLLISFLVASLKTVNHNEYGIAFARYAKRIDYDKVYEEGKYLLEYPSEFIKFKRTVQSLELNQISCHSFEGLAMVLNINVQYQLNKNQVFNLFDRFGNEKFYLDYLKNNVKQVVMETCALYNGSTYYQNRAVIEMRFERNIKSQTNQTNPYSTIILAQLISVVHPTPYSEMNTQKQNVIQEKTRILRRREETLNNERTRLIQAQKTVNITLEHARAERNITIFAAQQYHQTEMTRWEERAAIYPNSTTSDEVIRHLGYTLMSTKRHIIHQLEK